MKLTQHQRERFEKAAVGALTQRRLRNLLRDVVVAADRMRDNWAEGDETVKKSLWVNLHTAAETAHDEVYPLGIEKPEGDEE